MFRKFISRVLFAIGLLGWFGTPISASQNFASPSPGSVYKEFTRIISEGETWRVTDPNATYVGPAGNTPGDFLPNPELTLNIDDLQGAVRAEALIDHWGGHIGTTGKRFRFNGNSWIDLPTLTTTPGSPECYMQQWNMVVPIPLTDLVQGTNIFQGDSGPQTCYSFDQRSGWGQWGWYTMTVRVYYDSSKAHPTGAITAPASGATLGENPTLTATASAASGVDRVEFLAYYEGYDTDGDGVYLDYHRSYHRKKRDSQMLIANHAGTATGSPYQVSWDTALVPEQAPGSIKLVARIRGNNGVWFVTDEVTNITLQRSNASVQMYKPVNVPQKYASRVGNPKRSKFRIPTDQDLSTAVSATLLLATWNGIDAAAEPGQEHHVKVNNWVVPDSAYGANHFYSFDKIDIPVGELKTGDNIVEVYSETTGHAIEVLWPGPGMVVRYATATPPPPETAPAIITQPQDRSVTEGDTATFSVTASGNAPVSYQWQRNGVDISGANGASYTTPPTTLADDGTSFRVAISNNAGSVTSAAAVLGVSALPSAPPVIDTAPQDKTVNEGAAVSFTVTASGSTPLAYQWQRDGVDIAGANAASYTVNTVTAADNGAVYRVVVTNSAGSATSSGATLTVNLAPRITAAPGAQSVLVGQTATFSVTASGTGPLAYQWQRDGIDIAGAAGASYTTSATTLADDGTSYRVVVGNAVSTITSSEAILSVTPAPVAPGFSEQPANQTVTEGASATFSVAASGTAPLSYQWQRDGVVIAGATGASYTTPAATLADDGASYQAVVSNMVGSATSSAATLAVVAAPVAPPVIGSQPTDQTVNEGAAAVFTVVASGAGPLGYQWRRNGQIIAGANTASYTTPATTLADDGDSFTVLVINAGGSVASSAGLLSVSPHDSNSDGLSDGAAAALGLDPNDLDSDDDGLPDVDEVGADANQPLDSDGDGLIDALEPGFDAAHDASRVTGMKLSGGAHLSLSSTGERFSIVSGAPVTGGPAGVTFPYGMIGYRVSSAVVGGDVTVRLAFSANLPANLELYKIDRAGSFTRLPPTVWTLVDAKTLDLTLTDGDPLTDLDGAANGSIDDPVAPAAGVPVDGSASSSTSSSGGGGGCSLSVTAGRDPMLPLLTLISFACLWRRRLIKAL